MNISKKGKREYNESLLPLETDDLLLENIHNLKNSIRLYRKEINEKNNYIKKLKNIINFYKNSVKTINITWDIFNENFVKILNSQKENKNIENKNIENKNSENKNSENYEKNKNDNIDIKFDIESEFENEFKNEFKNDIEMENERLKYMINSPFYNINNFLKDFLIRIDNFNAENNFEIINKINNTCYDSDLSFDINENNNKKYKKIKLNDEYNIHKNEKIENIENKNEINNEKINYSNENIKLSKIKNNENYNNLKRKRSKEKNILKNDENINTEQIELEKIFEEDFPFVKLLKKSFTYNLNNTLKNINEIMHIKNVNINYDINFINTLSKEKKFYFYKYINEKKDNKRLKEECERLINEIDRLEKKIGTLSFHLIKNESNIYTEELEENKFLKRKELHKKDEKMDETKVKNISNSTMKSNDKSNISMNLLNNDSNIFSNSIHSNENICTKKIDEHEEKTIEVKKQIEKEITKEEKNEENYNYEENDEKEKTLIQSKIVLNINKILTKEKILKSEPFKKLVKHCERIYKKLKAKEKDVFILQREILKIENNKDNNFEKLMKQTSEYKNNLTKKIEKLETQVFTYDVDKNKMEKKVKCLHNEIEVMKNIDKEQIEQLKEKEKDIIKLKTMLDHYKNSVKKLNDKNANLKKEKEDLINSINIIEKKYISLKKKLINDNINIDLYESDEVHENNKINNQNVEEKKKDDNKNSLQNNCNFNLKNMNEIKNLDLENQIKHYIIKYEELIQENNYLKREIENKKHIEEELNTCKKNHDALSEEIEEITKEYEKKQEQVDEMIIKIKNIENEHIEKYNNIIHKKYVEEKLKQLETYMEEKITCVKQFYEKYEKCSKFYLSLFYHARESTKHSDLYKEEQVGLFIKLKHEYEKIFRKMKEMNNMLDTLYYCNKKLCEKCKTLSKECQNLKFLLSEKNKTQLIEYDQLNEQSKMLQNQNLLIEENHELRRRLLCTVCMENFRNYIIIKCGHIYCQKCVFNTIKSRNRKCPQCKIPYDKRDLQKIFLD